jgi:hypothetical protein
MSRRQYMRRAYAPTNFSAAKFIEDDEAHSNQQGASSEIPRSRQATRCTKEKPLGGTGALNDYVYDLHGSAVGFVTVSTSMARKVIARDLAVPRR